MMGTPLSPIELEAFDQIDAILHDASMRIDMMMNPGDLQLINNYAVMHSRTSFEDFREIELRRKKLRRGYAVKTHGNSAMIFREERDFQRPKQPDDTSL